MKALIYYGTGKLGMEERPMPEMGSKDVIVKIARAGICGSDLTAYLSDGLKVGILSKGQFGHDGQFGHEMAGIVYQVGADVINISVGDRVFINPAVCKKSGMMGCDIAGAFSEYVLVEDAALGYNLLKLADDVSFDEAVVIEPLAVGTHGKNCIQVRPNENVVVFGAGTIGICTLNAVMAAGCVRPVAVDVNAERLLLAEKMGAVGFHPGRGDIKEFLIQHFGVSVNPFGMQNANVDAFIDCAGANPVLNQIIGLCKEHARISIVAVYKQDILVSASTILSSQLTIKGSCGYEAADVMEAFQNVNHHRTQISEIVTHHFKHEDAVKAFEFASKPKSGAVKVVIDYDI